MCFFFQTRYKNSEQFIYSVGTHGCIGCTYCPAGKWCADQYTLAACAVGKYGFQGRTTPCNLDCPLGSYCPNGTG